MELFGSWDKSTRRSAAPSVRNAGSNEVASSSLLASSSPSSPSSPSPSPPPISQLCQLDRCRQWLSNFPAEDARAMQQTREFREFIQAFASLEKAHRHIIVVQQQQQQQQQDDEDMDSMIMAENVTAKPQETRTPPQKAARLRPVLSFLQHVAADDVLLRVFDFLESRSLAAAMMTCSRFQDLAKRNAGRRCREVARERQLTSVTELLRAGEQVDGVGGNAVHDPHVCVPMLLLRRRVVVTNCDDPEFNGVFYCTGSNGNGFVFTKPRHPDVRVDRPSRIIFPDGENEMTKPGRLLRCVISKRFSEANLLWYLSKEIVATEDNGDVRVGDITQLFCFYSNLMTTRDAAPNICQYPSQSSVLARTNKRWQSLPTVRGVEPPVLELLD